MLCLTDFQIRPVPHFVSVPHFQLCQFRPPKECPRGDACTYAHSEAEQSSWNHQKMFGEEQASYHHPWMTYEYGKDQNIGSVSILQSDLLNILQTIQHS